MKIIFALIQNLLRYVVLQEGNIVQWEKLTIAKPPVWDIVHHKRFITRDILCGLSGVIHSYDLTKASVYDINYLQDIKLVYHNCSIFGDRGYIGKEIQLDLFESANIKLECPYRLNQKDWKPQFLPFAKARKRIETDFSQ